MFHSTALTRRATAADQYLALELNTRLESADPHRLVAILYEELERSLDVLKRTILQGRSIASNKQIDRARSILIALEASLDLRAGGPLAETLAHVYRSMRKELGLVVKDSEFRRLENLIQGVESVSSAWGGIRSKP
jgi:flagellar secretion chaperone FliS